MGKKSHILSGLVLFLFLISFVSSAGYDWSMYGQDLQQLRQTQLSGISSLFNTSTIVSTNIAVGQDQFNHPSQPLVDELAVFDTNHLIIADGTQIKIYDGDLLLQTAGTSSYNVAGQLAIVDWDDNGYVGEIAGWYTVNSSTLEFQVWTYNQSTNLLDLFYSELFNFGVNLTADTSGVRCQGKTCYSAVYVGNGTGYNWYLSLINEDGNDTYLVYPDYSYNDYYPVEPLGMVDYNGDSKDDYLMFSEERIVIINEDGTLIRDINASRTNPLTYIRGAKFLNGDASPFWKVAFYYDVPNGAGSGAVCTGLSDECCRLEVVSIIDGSIDNEENILGGIAGTTTRCQGMAIADYNGDGYDDVWASAEKLSGVKLKTLYIRQADGTDLYSTSSLDTGDGQLYPDSQITLARMDEDSSFDVIFYPTGKIWSPAKDSYIKKLSISEGGQGSCIPADLTYNGVLDIICTDTSSTTLYEANYTNVNSQLISVTYDPSTSIAVGGSVNAFITANDTEGNNILYSGKCYNGDNYTSDSGSNVVSCNYAFVGSYNLTTRVRDAYHSDYDSFSQTIIVTSIGAICDNDGVCEAGQGETESNCPNDCVDDIQSTDYGEGLIIPSQIVDPDNEDEGFLPSIYYGTLAFFSVTLKPVMVLVFLILFVMIILAIGGILKKIVGKVATM